MNTKDCGDENDECKQFNKEYKAKCVTDKPWTVGDGVCQSANDTPQCKKDGGDCNPDPKPAKRQLRPRGTLQAQILCVAKRDWKGTHQCSSVLFLLMRVLYFVF